MLQAPRLAGYLWPYAQFVAHASQRVPSRRAVRHAAEFDERQLTTSSDDEIPGLRLHSLQYSVQQ
jgi:hypothetical protein